MRTSGYRLSGAVFLAVALGLGSSRAVVADVHGEDQSEAMLESVEVTGSRIKRADIESASPMFVIQREEIERTGLTSVGDLLQDLPIAGAALNTNFNNGGNGETRLDLRNLGPQRLLVLLNGRRFTANLSGVVDLNNFPVAIIKRIEIVKDGASSIYGSDAIAGVVNLITRDDFEGLQVNAYIGQYESENDGRIWAFDFSAGRTSGRGSMFFNGSYVKAEPVLAGDREISREPRFGTGTAYGSSATPQGRFGAGAIGFGLTTDPGADVAGLGAAAFRPGDFSSGVPGAGSDRYNFAPENYSLTPSERTNVFTKGTYELTNDARLYVEATFNNRISSQLLASTPLLLGGFGSGPAAQVGIAADNRYNVFGVDLLPADGFRLARRMIEAGPRRFRQDVDSYRLALGFEGSFAVGERRFDWDAGALFGEIKRRDRETGLVNIQRVQQALSGQPCRDDVFGDGCLELNLFGGIPANADPRAGDPGSITPAMLDYILAVHNDASGNEIRSYTANLTGEVAELPAGPLGFAIGYEYRDEEGFDSPDALVSAGISSGNSRQPTEGGFAVDEFYVELALPLLSGVGGAQRLDLSASARWSDYDTFGDTINPKLGVEWQPIGDLLLRGTWSEGFRAPAIYELFGGRADSFPIIDDPCNSVDTDDDGVPDTTPELPGCVGVPDGYFQPGSQIRTTIGSNPLLQPEESESVTLGIVYSPSWADGLDVTVDYYDVKLRNSITNLGAQNILTSCASTGTLLCELLTRSANGQVSDVIDAAVNIGVTRVSGIDFLVSYSFPYTYWGVFRVVWDAAYQGTNENEVLDAQTREFVTQSNLGFNLGDGVYPRWKSNVDFNWSFGDWDVTYGLQYVHHSEENCAISASFGFCNSDLDGDGVNEARHIGGTTYHDVQVSYHLLEYDTRLTFGVQNLLDKGPPLSTTAFADSYNRAQYRVPGVFPYVRVTVDF